MSLDALAGRSFGPTEPYEVTPGRVAEFASSTGGSYAGGAAPPTFPIVVVFAALRALIDDPTSGLTLARIVHGEQRFSYHRPVRPGDVLTARLTVESVRGLGEATYIRTVSEVDDQNGEHVVTAWATIIHRGGEPGAEGRTMPAPRSGETR